MALTDLTGTKWKMSGALIPANLTGSNTFYLQFTASINDIEIYSTVQSEAKNQINISITDDYVQGFSLPAYTPSYDCRAISYYYYPTRPYYWRYITQSTRTNTTLGLNAVLTIKFLGGSDATNQNFITWLQSNAVQIIENDVILETTIDSHKLGTTQIDKICLGNDTLWETKKSYTITPTLTNAIASASNPATIQEGETVELEFTTSGNYVVPGILPTIIGASATYARINDNKCVITLSNPIKNITFDIDGKIAWSGTSLSGTSWVINNITQAGFGKTTIPSTSVTTYNNSYWYQVSFKDFKNYLFLIMDNTLKIGGTYAEPIGWEGAVTTSVVNNIINFETSGSDLTNSTLIAWLKANASIFIW